MAKPTMPTTSKPDVQHQRLLIRVCLCRRMMRRSLIAMLQFADDGFLHRQPVVDHVDFDPTLEGEAVNELLVANTWT
ncbi:hypothetical protein [Rhizobium sp. GN54]|uniref:hypothetical protein n=1 Tax=Rhizobium sp. GN54 TaxID=2898150 RepID=UPI001E3E74BC|nr:hypothetical protein [Rhizobium sp. GN54]MCD2184867.1 hypothetical protein [Rhizobium sp. GN54]